MGKSGNNTTTQVQKADPWGPSQQYLKGGLRRLEQVRRQGGLTPTPYGGDRVAGFGPITQQAQSQLLETAGRGPSTIGAAQSSLLGMMDPSQYGADLDAVRSEILANAIPAATAQFAGSGMTDSSVAMQGVGRAATEALAPFEYGAYQTAADRALKASAMAPQFDPSNFQFQVGQQQDALSQAQLDADMARYYERENRPFEDLSRFSQLAMGYGGLGGQSSMQQPGPSTGSQVAGGLLTGLGGYGMATGMLGLSNPVGAAIGGGLGLLSLL